MNNSIMQETCRICKQTKPYTAAEYPLKSGVACAECAAKTSETFRTYYDTYSNFSPTPKQLKDNIAFLRSIKKRYELFDPRTDYCLYTADTLIMADLKNHLIAFFPTDCSQKRISVDLIRFREEKNCEIFMFEDLKDANALNSVNTDERFIMLNLKNSDAGFPSIVVTQKNIDGFENADLEELSRLLGIVLESRRQK